jgi:hypothetical protein
VDLLASAQLAWRVRERTGEGGSKALLGDSRFWSLFRAVRMRYVDFIV